ncbi:MAG: hypothetical protein QW548_02700 [Candidatus Aenigmatarchaeota archaeon]
MSEGSARAEKETYKEADGTERVTYSFRDSSLIMIAWSPGWTQVAAKFSKYGERYELFYSNRNGDGAAVASWLRAVMRNGKPLGFHKLEKGTLVDIGYKETAYELLAQRPCSEMFLTDEGGVMLPAYVSAQALKAKIESSAQ